MDVLKIRTIGLARTAQRGVHFLQWFFEKKGVRIEIEELEAGDPAQAREIIAQESGCDSIRVGFAEGAASLDLCKALPLMVSQLQTADLFLPRKGGGWECQLCALDGLRDSLIAQGRGLDTQHMAYVIGREGRLRVAAAAVLGLGYRKVFLVSEDMEDLGLQREVLLRVYVGSEPQTLNANELTLQTVGASLLVNATDLRLRPDLASDLAYFNFMNPGGLVVDLDDLSENNPMLEEALRAGLRVLAPHDCAARTEWNHVRALGLEDRSTPLEFINGFYDFLRETAPKT